MSDVAIVTVAVVGAGSWKVCALTLALISRAWSATTSRVRVVLRTSGSFLVTIIIMGTYINSVGGGTSLSTLPTVHGNRDDNHRQYADNNQSIAYSHLNKNESIG